MAVAQPGADPAKDWTKIVSRQIPDFGQIPTGCHRAPRPRLSYSASLYGGRPAWRHAAGTGRIRAQTTAARPNREGPHLLECTESPTKSAAPARA